MVKKGDMIELVETTEMNLKSGDKGKVKRIERLPTEQYILWVNWDNGNCLPLIEGEDRFKVIKRDA